MVIRRLARLKIRLFGSYFKRFSLKIIPFDDEFLVIWSCTDVEKKVINRCYAFVIIVALVFIFLFTQEDFTDFFKSILIAGKNLLASDSDGWGQLGDFVGGILNPVFGFLSFMALIVTLLIQSKELAASTKAIQRQGENLKVQSFEAGLFSMINIHHENVKGILLAPKGGNKFEGRATFNEFVRRLKEAYSLTRKLIASSDEIEIHIAAYKSFFRTNEEFIGYYLRFIGQLLVYVDARHLEEKEHYWSIIKSQLSDDEVLLIFYHLAFWNSKVSFSKIKSSGFFSNLSSGSYLSNDFGEQIQEGYVNE